MTIRSATCCTSAQTRYTALTAERLATRFSTPQQEAVDDTAPATPAPRAPTRMTTRSWYLPRETADALTAAAERIRHTVPAVSKADALDALLRYALDHETEVSQTLADSRTP